MNSSATSAGTDSDLFLQKLRQSTLPAHKALEQLPISQIIVDPTITKEQYTEYLSLMAGVVADIEENIFPLVQSVMPDLQQRKKLPAMNADLEMLSASRPTEVKPITGTGFTFTPASAMGAMYVIEGSTLGGRVILKNIEKALGFNEENGAKYFSGYSNQTGPLWKSFLETFTSYAVANNVDEVIAGADFTFSAISKHLSHTV